MIKQYNSNRTKITLLSNLVSQPARLAPRKPTCCSPFKVTTPKFCSHLTSFGLSQNFLGHILLIFTLIFSFINSDYVSAKHILNNEQIETVSKNVSIYSEILSDIDKYQERYFKIIKRNDVFLSFESNNTLNRDRKDLKKLYNKVKKQIRNKKYLKEYKEIEKRYSKCNEETTIGINSFMENNYNEIDNLLNKVYKEVQQKIPPEDFKYLVLSEKKWLKEVNSYEDVYNSMGFGTIGTMIYLDYQIDMRKFRTLLLMLYL